MEVHRFSALGVRRHLTIDTFSFPTFSRLRLARFLRQPKIVFRGKPLRNALYIVRQNKFGMQGRLLLFQEHPFECQSNYGALGALRCNLDMQDLRRVYPADDWLDEEPPPFGPRPAADDISYHRCSFHVCHRASLGVQCVCV